MLQLRLLLGWIHGWSVPSPSRPLGSWLDVLSCLVSSAPCDAGKTDPGVSTLVDGGAPRVILPPRCGGQPAGSQYRTIVDSGALNTAGWVFGCECVSISGGSAPSEEFCSLCTLGFLRHYWSVFPRGFTSSALTTNDGSFSCATPLSAPGIFCLSILATLVGV